jgi:hypothetical protein
MFLFLNLSQKTFEGIQNSVYTNLYRIPWIAAAYTIPFVLSLVFLYLNFHMKVYVQYKEFRIHKPIRDSVEFRGIVH